MALHQEHVVTGSQSGDEDCPGTAATTVVAACDRSCQVCSVDSKPSVKARAARVECDLILLEDSEAVKVVICTITEQAGSGPRAPGNSFSTGNCPLVLWRGRCRA